MNYYHHNYWKKKFTSLGYDLEIQEDDSEIRLTATSLADSEKQWVLRDKGDLVPMAGRLLVKILSPANEDGPQRIDWD